MSSPTKRDFRNSRGSLPLPASLSAASTTSNLFSIQQATSARLPAASTSPTSAHFPLHSLHSPQMLSSSTHAGGIQPSSSFFRPARPMQQQYTPQTEPDADHYPLSPLNPSALQEQKRHSLAHSSIDDQDPPTDTTEDPQSTQMTSLKRIKHSREPLLPIGGSSHVRRPSVVTTIPVSPLSSPKKSPVGRVRTSLDRVFGLSFPNRLSFDSIRNRNSAAFDEERAERPVTPTKTPQDPSSPSPMRFHKGNAAPSSRSHSPAPSHSSSTSPAPSTPTPPPSFIATAPTPTPTNAHLSHTPILKPNSSKPLRKYALHPSRNRFLLSGRLLTGGDTPYAFLASLGLLFGLAGLWFSTTCVFWWNHSAGGKAIVIIGAYLAAVVVSTMLTTATTDPGILPRGLDPDPPYPATSPSDGGVKAPMPRDLRVRQDVVRVKYCPTCKTYRPPRSSHCKMCDNCVDGCDHHCQWVNNCIGRRNYTTFFALLCAATSTLILIIITSALHLWLLTTLPAASGEHRNFHHALSDRRGVGSAVAFCLSIAVIWPVGALLAYHMRLSVLNVTTIEMIRNQAHKSMAIPGASKPPNPFSHGTSSRNFAAVLCRPKGFSWLDPRAVATQDAREVNPGMRGAGSGGGERDRDD